MKQVRVSDVTHEEIKAITVYKQTLSPHKTINIQSVVADLIAKEAKRVKRKEV